MNPIPLPMNCRDSISDSTFLMRGFFQARKQPPIAEMLTPVTDVARPTHPRPSDASQYIVPVPTGLDFHLSRGSLSLRQHG